MVSCFGDTNYLESNSARANNFDVTFKAAFSHLAPCWLLIDYCLKDFFSSFSWPVTLTAPGEAGSRRTAPGEVAGGGGSTTPLSFSFPYPPETCTCDRTGSAPTPPPFNYV